MKSIMEQGSSIMKAVEKAWSRAGNPQDFSIKVFEKEEKNFFGITTKPAKIGIFFSDTTSEKSTPAKAAPTKSPAEKQKEKKSVVKPVLVKNKKQQPAIEKVAQEAKSLAQPTQSESQKVAEQQQKPLWDEKMIAIVHKWLQTTLTLMEKSVPFSMQVAGKNLNVIFTHPILGSTQQDKHLFRSFACLLIASLRNQCKQEMRDLKVVLIHE